MAFSLRNPFVLTNANGFTLWHYGAGALDHTRRAGFFADAADLMAEGDMVMLTGAGRQIALAPLC